MGYSTYETSPQEIMVALLIMCSSRAWHIQDMAYNYHDSLHMSQRGNGVLHYQIHSHKVDFIFKSKMLGK